MSKLSIEEIQRLFSEKTEALLKEHANIIEKNIKEVLAVYDCKPSQIQLRVMPQYKYEVIIKASEFQINHDFIIDINN
jgi:hypothetical protein